MTIVWYLGLVMIFISIIESIIMIILIMVIGKDIIL